LFYFVVSKSSNYCFASRDNPYGLLILCQVALGDVIEYANASYDADRPVKAGKGHSTKGLGATIPDPAMTKKIDNESVAVPCGTPTKLDSVRSSLLYNEYIVYDTAQVKMR
jgi:poly [ADP-ribose] polymerase